MCCSNIIFFGIAEGQRVGLIAKNGTGKSTLLNIIGGKDGYDEGSVVFRRDLNVGYLEQGPSYPPDLTVIEACFSHGNAVTNLIREYENCMNTPGNPRLEEILDRMEKEKSLGLREPGEANPVAVENPFFQSKDFHTVGRAT